MTLRVGVIGAGGRMGQVVCQAVSAEADLSLVAAVDPSYAGIDIGEVAGVAGAKFDVAPDNQALLSAGVEVVVDFTHVDAARANIEFCAEHGMHAVVGTSGFTVGDHERIARRDPQPCAPTG